MEMGRFDQGKRQRGIVHELSPQNNEDIEGAPLGMQQGCKDSAARETVQMRKWAEIKLSAIYDDEEAIARILKSETNPDSVQALLSMQDERGQPCIFYAIESRSKKAMVCLLDFSKNTDCVIAANGESLLHVATKIGCFDIFKHLMAWDLVTNLIDHVENENGKAPLHLAAEFNHVEIARELLLHGAKLDRKDTTGHTPIFMAASKGYTMMLEVFLKHGGRSVQGLMLDSCLYGSNYGSLLQVAVSSGNEKTVQVCLDQDPHVVRKCLQEEVKRAPGNLIHAACLYGMEHCLLKIVESVEDLEILQLNRKDNLGFTPIHKAASNNHVHLVKYLGSISKSYVNQTTVYSQTPLVLAAQLGNIKVVEELLNLEADFRISDDSARTVLHYGVCDPDVLRILLKRKDLAQCLVNAKEKDGFTPVHYAAMKGLYESLNILLEHGGILNVFTNTSRSPLHCAVTSQRIEVVQLVLSKGAALVNKADAMGKTPLHTAASYGNKNIVRCLLDYGALIVSDSNLYSPLHIAAQKGHLAIVEMLVTVNRDIIEWKNKYGRTALITAASTGKTDVVKLLLEKNASLTEDYEFLNCLDWCIIMKDKDTAMVTMLDSRWREILMTTRHGPEATMTKLVYQMPKVAYRVLSNCLTSQGHPDSEEHVKHYDFICLQAQSQSFEKIHKLKPLTAIEVMVNTQCYSCICHPVCRKFLKSKWMDFGWRVHIFSLLLYVIFLVALNTYAFHIPSFKKTNDNPDEDYDASVDIKISMAICLVFTGVNAFKELMQLIFYKHRYFLDPVNYLECVMYVCVFIFAIPTNQKIAVKTSLQWKSCSVALLLAWINLVIYLRRFGSCGIYVLMMKKICVTLMKVLSLLIFFFVAFAAAFTPIMNDRQGFTNLGLSMLTSAVMTMGEFDFKETFLDEASQQYETFYWLRLALLIAFLILMPVILMNMLLALAIGDTNSILQQAKLRKHIQTARMIIDLERKRASFPWCSKRRMVPALEERPNKPVHFLRSMWEYLFYGPDFAPDEDTKATRSTPSEYETVERKLAMIVDMMKDMREHVTVIQQKMAEKENGATSRGERSSDNREAHDMRETHDTRETRRTRETRNTRETREFCNQREYGWTQFCGNSFGKDSTGTKCKECGEKRDVSTQFRENPSVSWNGTRGTGSGNSFLTEEQDAKDEKDREKKENNPALIELKQLYKTLPLEECLGVDNDDCQATAEVKDGS